MPFLVGTTLLGLLVPSPAAAMDFHLRLPGPRQTAVAVAQLRYKDEAPRSLRLKLENPDRLGGAYRGIYAVYRARHGGTAALTVITLVLRREMPAGSARPASTASASTASRSLGVFFEPSSSGPDGSGGGETATALGMRAPTPPMPSWSTKSRAT